LGLAYRPRARYGERVSEAGSRRQSREYGGGLSMILRAAQAALAGERALVEGRRPGIGEAVVFDETAAEAVPGGFAGKVRPKGRAGSEGSRQRASEATSQARLAVDNAAVGRCSAEEHSIEAPPGPRGTTSSRRRDRGNPGGQRVAGCGKAEAGGSPSSEASPGGSPEAIGRGWVGAHRRVGRSGLQGQDRAARRGAHPGIGQSRGCSDRSRLQKSVGRIFLASVVSQDKPEVG